MASLGCGAVALACAAFGVALTLTGCAEEVCKPWCDATHFDDEMGFGEYCNDPKGCHIRTLMHDAVDILYYPAPSASDKNGLSLMNGHDFAFQHMFLIRNGVCPKTVDTGSCGLNGPERCGTCSMDVSRGDKYLYRYTDPKYSLGTISMDFNGNRDNVLIYGLSATTPAAGYTDVTDVHRTFHKKQDMWAEFKRHCGSDCKTDEGLKFLPNTYDWSNRQDLVALSREFKPNAAYIAKKEDKKSVMIFKAATVTQLKQDMQDHENDVTSGPWTLVQELLDQPALAKVGDSTGFVVDMRVMVLLTCSREKQEWIMFRAGSYINYVANPYSPSMDPSDTMVVSDQISLEQLTRKGYISRKDAIKWPQTAIGYLNNLKEQGWTNDVDAEWKKIEGVFKASASVYDGILCDSQDQSKLEQAGKMVHLIGADIRLRATVANGHKALQPYLIEWNTGPDFFEAGVPQDVESRLVTLAGVHRHLGLLRNTPFLPLFSQKEYQYITPKNFDEEGVVWTTVASKTNPFGAMEENALSTRQVAEGRAAGIFEVVATASLVVGGTLAIGLVMRARRGSSQVAMRSKLLG